MDKVYSISEAAAKVEVEAHVLRYWEEELEIDIKRNEMGHRYYEERDIKILQRVKTLKDKGIQLRAIKDIVHRMYELLEANEEKNMDQDEKSENKNKKENLSEEKGSEKKASDVSTFDTIRVTCDDIDKDIEEVCRSEQESKIVDFKMAQFQNMMDKIVSGAIKENLKVITQSVSAAVSEDVVKQMDVLIKEKEEQEEARYRKLDLTIREMQQTRKEVAATEINTKKRGIFRKKQK